MYTAVHIADAEVSALLTEYTKVTGMSKTEAIRRLLREAVQEQRRQKNKTDFVAVAKRIVEKNRWLNLPSLTKEEQDAVFE